MKIKINRIHQLGVEGRKIFLWFKYVTLIEDMGWKILVDQQQIIVNIIVGHN